MYGKRVIEMKKEDKRRENKGRPSKDRNIRIVVLLNAEENQKLREKIGTGSASAYTRDLIIASLEK